MPERHLRFLLIKLANHLLKTKKEFKNLKETRYLRIFMKTN